MLLLNPELKDICEEARHRVERIALTLVLPLIAAGVVLHAPAVLAQEASADPEQVIEEVVVTGIRRSIIDAIALKRGADQITDAISAEDIGRLPDENVAESLQRINGVQLQRRNGEGAGVAVRGLTANRLELDGVTVVNPTGRNSGPDEGTYPVLQFISSSLLSGVSVAKSASADQVEGSLGGTVNLAILNPFEARPGINLSVEGAWDDRTGDIDPRVSGTWVTVTPDERFGVLLSYTQTARSVGEELFFTRTGWAGQDTNGDGTPDTNFAPGDIRFQTLEEDRGRSGLLGSVRTRPNDTTELYLTAFHATFDLDRDRSWFSSAGSGGTDPAGYMAPTISPSGSILTGGFTSQIQGNGEALTNESTTWSVVAGGSHVVGAWDISGSVSVGAALQEDRQDFARIRHNGVMFRRDFSGSIPRNDVTDGFDLTNPASYDSGSGLIGFNNAIDYENDELAVRFDVTYDLGGEFLESISGGFVRADQEATRFQLRAGNNHGGSVWIVPTVGGLAGNVDANLYRVVPLSDVYGGRVSNVPAYLAADPGGLGGTDALLRFVNTNFNPADTTRNDQGRFIEQPDGNYGTAETITAGYARADFGGDGWGGNVGVRYIRTEQDSAFNVISSPGGVRTVQEQSFGRSYNDLLPSINLRFDLTETTVLRLGASQTMSRPTSAALNGGIALDEAAGTASGGNPELEPARADAFDLSLEWYPNAGSSVSVAAFRKDVTGFLESQTIQREVSGATNNNPASPDFGTNRFLVTSVSATDESNIAGIEFSYQNVFDNGFGVQANYTYIDSDGLAGLPLTGLSENSYNVVGFYETERISARVAYNFRDDFLVTPSFNGVPMFEKGRGQLDGSLQYRLGDRWAVTLEAINLNDERVDQFAVVEERAFRIARTGTRMFLGIRGEF